MKKKFFRFLVVYMTISLVAVNFAFLKVETAKADEATPTSITTCEELQSIGISLPLDGDYILEAEDNVIDCSAINVDNGDGTYGFVPIGSDNGNPFTGTLDGNNNTISGLYISRYGFDNVGLFFSFSGRVYDLNFTDASIEGDNRVGVLAGESSDSIMENISVNNETGGYIDADGNYIGGLVGYFSGSIASSSYVGGEIYGMNYFGGLVGAMIGTSNNTSSIENSFADVIVSTKGDDLENVGGLVGYSDYADISNSYFAGGIGSYDTDNIGGLVGSFSNGTINSSYVNNLDSSILAYSQIGGLVGRLSTSTIINSYSNMSVLGMLDEEHPSPAEIGGLVGYSYNSTISKSYSGDLSTSTLVINLPDSINLSDSIGITGDHVGGLVGKADKTNISNTYSNFSIKGNDYLGGLVGSLVNGSSVTNSYSIGLVANGEDAEAGEYFGGLVAYKSNDSSVAGSYYDSVKSGMSDINKGQAKTSFQLKTVSTFADWNFTNTWEMISGYSPTLRGVSGDNFNPIPDTVYVNSTWTEGSVGEGLTWGQNAFSDINTAISGVAEGGTVYLLDSVSGGYDFYLDEKVNLNKAVNIIGEDLGVDDKVLINIGAYTSSLFEINSSNVTISNLKIRKNINTSVSGFDIKFSDSSGSDITISNNDINGLSGIEMYNGDSFAFSGINILNNKIVSTSGYGIFFYSELNNYSNLLIEGNEIVFDGYAYGLDLEGYVDNIIIRNNKIYDLDATNSSSNVYSSAAIYFWMSDSLKHSIDISRNWWGSDSGPNIHLNYDYCSEDLVFDSSFGRYVCPGPSREYRELLIFNGNNSNNTNNIILEIPVVVGDRNPLSDFNFNFRPFCTNSSCSELSDKKIIISEENGLSELFTDEYFGTMNISPDDFNEADSTKAKKIKVAEKLDIEIPAASGVASTTISLPANTEITKSDTEEDKYFTYQDLSAAELATNALSGFQSGELIGALQWGIPSVGLSFSSPVTIEMYVGTELAGQVLELYRSISTSGGWTKDGLEGIDDATTDGTCLVNETGMCKFKTTKASYFGVLKASSSNSSVPITLPAGIGSGARDVSSVSIGAALHAGEITGSGVNFLTYVTNQNHFISQDSSNKREKTNHHFVITSLDLNTEIANITFHSDPKTISIKKGETQNVDLDGDKVNDISVTFSNIYVNRAEITIKSLASTYPTVSESTNTSSTTEVVTITNDKMYNKLKGKIIIKVEDSGRAYYVSPVKKEMYYLGRPTDAFSVMRSQGVGIKNSDLNKILISGDKIRENISLSFSKKQIGKIFLQVEDNGEAWYVDLDGNRHFLGRPNDAFRIMRSLSLGISNIDFAKLIK